MKFSRFLPSIFATLFSFAFLIASIGQLQAACTVTNTDDSGAGSLRQAILDANGGTCGGLIDFNLGAGTPTINVGSTTAQPLPNITQPVTINGNTGGSTRIELNGTAAGGGVNGLHITAGGCTVKGLVINRFDNDGILIDTNGGNMIQGNIIGLNAAGDSKLGNGFLGVEIVDTPNNLIGGLSAGEGNIISGNGSGGMQIDGDTATGNQIQGNFIGSDLTGTVNLANGSNAIGIGSGSNTIGGTTPGARNLLIDGINLFLGSHDTVIQGNFIGTDVTGTQSLGSVVGGIFIFTTNNTIGGTVPGAGNVIAFNPDFGIATVNNAGTGNTILGNSIFANDGLGIDLLQDGITANDAGDGDTGPNNIQNFPVLSSAVSANGNTTIQGTLDSTAGGNFRIEFFSNTSCDPSGNGEGQTFLGAVDAPNGNFNAVLPVSLNALFITATATDNATKDTSEFSACLLATILVEDCSNGTDDDGDQLADCDDPDCAAIPACAPSSEICDDGIDDDGDGTVDCEDPDCTADPACNLDVSGSGCALGGGGDGNSIWSLISLLPVIGLSLKRRRKAH